MRIPYEEGSLSLEVDVKHASPRQEFPARRNSRQSEKPSFKTIGLRGKTLNAEDALKLAAGEPNLIKPPLVIVGRITVAGFDRDK